MSLERLEALIETSPYPWWQWEVQTNTLTFNRLKATMLGYSVEDFHGRGYQAFTSLVHGDDYERTMEAMRKVLYDDADLYQIDYRIRDSEGHYHWYMDRGFVIRKDDNGRPLTIRGIVIDLGKEGEVAGGATNAFFLVSRSWIQDQETPKSFVTVCASCRRMKVRSKIYVDVTPALSGLLSDEVSHSVCPDCMKRLYPELNLGPSTPQPFRR